MKLIILHGKAMLTYFVIKDDYLMFILVEVSKNRSHISFYLSLLFLEIEK